MTEQEFRDSISRAMLYAARFVDLEINRAVEDIALLLRGYKLKNSLDVWYGNPTIKSEIEKVLRSHFGRIAVLTENQIKGAWEAAEDLSDRKVKNIIAGIGTGGIVAYRIYKWFNRQIPEGINPGTLIQISPESLNQILKLPRIPEARNLHLRKLDLSARVWRIADEQVKPLIESFISKGFEEGTSANVVAKGLKQYLNNPDALFRRVRDKKTGKLQLSSRAMEYHPGQGVYRSAFQNARRLAAEEINFSHRQADFERWQSLDFIKGIEVKLSNNHPVEDICDEAKGLYPKDFFFCGWHVRCRCYAVPIMPSPDEFLDILTEEKPIEGGITGTPDSLNKWIGENSDRLKNWKSKPYFLTLNEKYFGKS